jgi:ubiquinone/menaquinone biosynthesis C-methylase UbiE
MSSRSILPTGKIQAAVVYPLLFPLLPRERVVILGCGDGPQLAAYAKSGAAMVGVDINADRLITAEQVASTYGVKSFNTVHANVEQTTFEGEAFDKAIAVDIIQHVDDVEQFCRELRRILVPMGTVLLTFPALRYRYEYWAGSLKRILLRGNLRRVPSSAGQGWNPEAVNTHMSVANWIREVENHGFKLRNSRASTMFPPLHLAGIPRFWFTNPAVRTIDQWVCRIPMVKRFGQAYLGVFEKIS